MTTLEQTRTWIRLEAQCDYPWCQKHAQGLYDQLSVPHYSQGASVLKVPFNVQEWRSEHRTARKRADRAERLGYRFAEVDYSEYSDDIYDINVSLPERQGRPMTNGYTVRRQHGELSEDQTRCPAHRTHTYGVLQGDTLRAYSTIHRAGDLAMVSMILGHGDHRDAGIMYLLFQGIVAEHSDPYRYGFFYYNRHDSGRKDGLVFYKERLGFRATDIEWLL